MDQGIRNKLRNVVTQCRKLLEDAVAQVLQGQFGIYPTGKKDEVHVEEEARMTHLAEEDRACRRDLLDHFEHIQALGYRPKDALAQLVREVAFTHLNRLCAYKMMEARGVVVNGGPFREAVSRGLKSQGFLFYLAEHPKDEKRYNSGHQDVAYRHFLDWLGGTLSEEIGVLFSPNDPANRLYPPQRVLDAVLDLINTGDIKPEETELQQAWPAIWSADETIGWVYQYFTPKELRDQARKESAAPRNSYELAFRNQFFTPRYVVEFLTDNTLGRIWYEMRKGQTRLNDQCRYMVRRPSEVFLAEGESPPSSSDAGAGGKGEDLSQEELLKEPVHIPHRPKKDPREIKILDPACGSGHFLLYCFDLLETIYEEAYDDPDLPLFLGEGRGEGVRALREDYPTRDDLRRAMPGLILAHNLHGIDIDLRATQIAALALWLRCHRAYQQQEIKKDRPRITRSNIVCAEPMPGEKQLLEDFLKTLRQDRLETLIQRVMQVPEGTRVRATQSMVDSLCELVHVVWEKMRLAGEAGSLLRIEEELQEAVRVGQEEWEEKQPLFRITEFGLTEQPKESYLRVVPGEGMSFWQQAEHLVMAALHDFAAFAGNGHQLQRRLFADDALRGFAFVDLCQHKFDAVLMNPPFGDASIPSKPYIESVYADTKGDVYKAFVECFQDRLVPAGMLGIISSRTGFFLGRSADWRERILLRLYRVTSFADFGQGVLDAVVETAAYVLRSLSEAEDRELTFRLVPQLRDISTDRQGTFSIPKYQRRSAGLKRHQAEAEIRRLLKGGFLELVPGHFRRYRAVARVCSDVLNSISGPAMSFMCFQLTAEPEKQTALVDVIASILNGKPLTNCFAVSAESLSQVPGSPFAYWVSQQIRELFVRFPAFETSARRACITNPAGEDQRYFRCHWEVPVGLLGQKNRWVPIARGGRFSPFYWDVKQVVDWDDAEETYRGFTGTFHRPMKRPASLEHFFKPGLTWPLRGSRFSCQALPQGCIFSVSGKFATSDDTAELPALLGLMNSALFDFLVGFFAGKVGGVQYEVGLINKVPVPLLNGQIPQDIGAAAISGFNAARRLDSACETSHAFTCPSLLQASDTTLAARSQVWLRHATELSQEVARQQRLIDDLAIRLYGLTTEDQRQIEGRHALSTTVVEATDEGDPEVDGEEETSGTDESSAAQQVRALLSYFVGCCFGRWNIEYQSHVPPEKCIVSPFEPLPRLAPGAMPDTNGFPVDAVPYQLRINGDGIQVDDSSHSEDIAKRIAECFEIVWRDQAEAIEKEACEIIGVMELRDYLRKPGKAGFWDDHISRYSMSRRRSPIYWLLQSSKKNYALWLYYHRLDKDILFKALVNYVEPKIRLEENRLDGMRGQRGTSDKATKKLDKEIEKQESLLSELRDFEDKLRRAANLHLEPDLNDGVVLNIAPLWELVPWREAKDYWKELLEGKYEWSSIGKQLREKGLVKA